jgi:cadmium resistance protein CadD (predicted permease)
VKEKVMNMEIKSKSSDRSGQMIGGFIVLAVGVIFLLHNFNLIPSIGKLWPVLPIIVGVGLIIGALKKTGSKDESFPG